MPSICTHLLIAEDALEALPPGPDRTLLESQRPAYFLGCLAPDLPYFDIFDRYRGLPLGAVLSPVTHTLEAKLLAWLGWSMPEHNGWAGRLHGLGTLKMLRAWAAWARPRHSALSAMLTGMLTHLAADEVLHPKIVADSGGTESAESLRKHRELEINLDLTLLRQRGVAIESMDYAGLLGIYLGPVDRRGEYLSPSLKHNWILASQACDAWPSLTRGEVDAWSRGFAGAMRLLHHSLSPMQQEKRRFLAKGEERWRTHFAREAYLSAHVPRAIRAAQRQLQGTGVAA
jgi:hypothetical protein